MFPRKSSLICLFYLSKTIDKQAIPLYNGRNPQRPPKGESGKALRNQEISMSNIERVKELRSLTGISIAECNAALNANDNDLVKAQTWLREKSADGVDAKKDRVTSEGVVMAVVSEDQNAGGIITCRCETDFVSRSDQYIKEVSDLATVCLEIGHGDASEIIRGFYERGTQLFKENLELAFTYITTEGTDVKITPYTHSNRIGVLILSTGSDDDAAKKVAMHVASENPLALNTDMLAVTEEYITEVDYIKNDVARNMKDKPVAVQEKIVSGKVAKYVTRNSLLDQKFVMDTDLTVAKFIENKIVISDYFRNTL